MASSILPNLVIGSDLTLSAGSHPCNKIVPPEPPKPALPFTKRVGWDVSLARPAGQRVAVETAEEVSSFIGSKETIRYIGQVVAHV
jgi:hypothetical protein